MKTQYTLIFIAMVAAIVSCSKKEEPITLSERVVLSASMEYPQTKAALNSEGTKVLWEPGDSINVFYGKVSSKFHATATEVSANTTFTGTLGVDENGIDKFIAVYPYREGNTYDGESVIVEIPDIQIARTGSFDRDAFVTIAASTDHRLQFKNLCGGVAFTVMQANVNKIVFSGSNGEYIAGKAKVTLDDKGVPEITAIIDGRTSIELRAPEGTCFEMGKWYYIAALPNILSSGFTIQFYGKQKTEVKNEKSVSIKRAVWGRIESVDDDSIIFFEDTNFKVYCLSNFDKDGDGEISVSEASLVKIIDVNTDNILSLGGVESFINLQVLLARGSYAFHANNENFVANYENYKGSSSGDNRWPSPGMTIASGQLSSLDISGFKYLRELDVSCNDLSYLDISDGFSLQKVNCSFCNITELVVGDLLLLQTLQCAGNQLVSLDVSTSTGLIALECYANQLKAINLSCNKELTSLRCSNNQLSSLDINRNTSLRLLECENNLLSSIDLAENERLSYFTCWNNLLTSIDISNCIFLEMFWCGDNLLSDLDVNSNLLLTSLSCNGNQLSSLNVSNNMALVSLDCSGNQIQTLDVSNNTKLRQLSCRDTRLSSLELSYNTCLTYLDCGDNLLSELDLSNNLELESLSCSNNRLSTLDLSNNTELLSLWCSENRLTSLNTNSNFKLSDLWCDYNLLSSLDLRNNTALTQLWCHNNLLTSLDVSNNEALSTLSCGNNPYLAELWLKNGQTFDSLLSYDSNITTIKYK